MLTIAVGAPPALGAQSGAALFVAGVADAETGQPLEGAEVLMVKLRRLARANGMGEAIINEVPHGVQRVRVRRLGYAPAELDIPIAGDTAGAVFRLSRIATQLGAVKVEAERVPPNIRDFEARRRQGIGRFVTEADMAKEQNHDFSTVAMMRFPGLTLVPDPENNGRLVLASRRSAGVRDCYVQVYLDGVDLGKEYPDWVRTWDVAAVEYYTGLQVPVRYRGKAFGCGVLLLWSKWY